MKAIAKKTWRMLEVEHDLGESVESYMRRRFVDDNVTLYELSDEMNVSYRMVLKWLKMAGIYSRRLGIGGD